MSPIEITHEDALEWQSFGGGEDAAIHHSGDAERPQCFEIRCPPGYTGRFHAHESDEVIFVLQGELRVGDDTLFPGASLFVPRRTLYRLDAGPEGVRYVNFRPHRDGSLLTESDLT